MRFIRLVGVICTAFFMNGCASLHVPEVPQHSIPANATVGLLVNVGDNPSHAHIGTTLFNNFNKKYSYDWNMKNEIFRTYKETIESSTNLKVINLETYGIRTAAQLDFVDIKNKQWSVVEANSNLRNKLVERNLYAVITVTETPTLASLECGAGGCQERYLDGYGVFSRSFMGIKNFTATAGFEVTAEIITPPIDLGAQKSLRDLSNFQAKSKLITGFKPQNIKNITDQELVPVKAHVLQYIQSVAEATRDFLR